MCFWYSYARGLGKEKRFCKNTVKKAFLKFYNLPKPTKEGWTEILKNYKGFALTDLEKFECQAQVAIWIYSLEQSRKRVYPELRRKSEKDFKKIIRLAVFKDHLMLIKDPLKFGQSYACSRCGGLYKTRYILNRHFKTCKNQFSRSVYKTWKGEVAYYRYSNSYKDFMENMPDYPGLIAFDFECMLPEFKEKRGKSTVLRTKHILSSAAVAVQNGGGNAKSCAHSRTR